MSSLWRPSASLATLRARAALFAAVRKFFDERGVLEVDTPILSQAGTVDPNVESLGNAQLGWLHTSPEFPMKRLLAAGSGAIYQLVHVFRVDEVGRHHQPEFTMLEWYRPGFGYQRLMDEVAALLQAIGAPRGRYERLSYAEAFRRYTGIDAFQEPAEAIREHLIEAGVELASAPSVADTANRDFWLDLAMATRVSPQLGLETPCFVYDYPATQAALSRIRADVPPVAERFELFWKGIELANGFHELADAEEQGRRFTADCATRATRGQPCPAVDKKLLAALTHGLPECSGVALGVDRVLMLLLGLPTLAEAQSFDSTRA
ncbi:MAG TPA: EF-P lysine aminoacylase EpmA [Nevskiaceae bacterium]|nr:EF-P lysine aminoacylase EpmA [Nevskiaceae bacterium]